jgi:hypothetical protein
MPSMARGADVGMEMVAVAVVAETPAWAGSAMEFRRTAARRGLENRKGLFT